MGYYSKVTLVIEHNVSEKLFEYLKTIDGFAYEPDDNDESILYKFLLYAFECRDEKYDLFVWNWVKWYSSEEENEAYYIQKFLTELEDQSVYTLKIVGEDIGDAEEYGTLYDDPFETEIVRDIIYYSRIEKREEEC